MMKSQLMRAVVAGLCLGLMACSSQPKQSEAQAPVASQPQTQQPASSQPETQRYDLKGKVVAVDKPGKKITVDHEAIPGFMGAMTMAYPVKDEHQLDNVSAGQSVTAKVVSMGSEYWLEDIARSNGETPAK